MTRQSLVAAIAASLSLAAAPAFADQAATDIWKAKCKSCHAESGNGDTREGRKHKVPDMSAAEWQAKHSDAEIKDVIANGVNDTKMKAYKDKYSDAEIDALVRHIRTLGK